MNGDQIDTSPHVRVRVHACEPFIENPVVKKQQQLEYRSFLRGFSLKEKNEPSDQPANDRKKLTGSSYCRDQFAIGQLYSIDCVLFFFFTPQLMVL